MPANSPQYSSQCCPSEERALRRRIKHTQLASRWNWEFQAGKGLGSWHSFPMHEGSGAIYVTLEVSWRRH
jgi:hypothetical protein